MSKSQASLWKMQHFPCITDAEFRRACNAFQNRNIASQNGISNFHSRYDANTLSIPKVYPIPRAREEADHVDPCTLQNGDDGIMIDEIEDSEETFPRDFSNYRPNAVEVRFSIIYSAVYQVPVLWFSLDRPQSGSHNGIDFVYETVVPEDQRPGLRNVGVMGAISVGYHPETDLPAFFIHPCNTADALREVCQGTCSLDDYLTVWLGIIGPSVGLYIPSELMNTSAAESPPS